MDRHLIVRREKGSARRGVGRYFCRSGLSLLLLVLASACAVDADGSEIWYVNNLREIRTINPTTLRQRVVIPQNVDALITNPGLSPDGGKIAYIGPGGGNGSSVWLADSDGSNNRRISQAFAHVSYVWLNDHSLVIMGSGVPYLRPDEGQVVLYDVSAQTTRPLVLPDKLALCGSPRRPDRVTSWSDRYPALGRLQVRDGSLIEIPDVTINVPESIKWRFGRACLSWSADAQKIVILGYGESDNLDLFATTDGGRTVKRLTNFAENYEQTSTQPFDISPDGKWVIFDVEVYRPADPNLFSGEQIALVATNGGGPEFLMGTSLRGYFAWSPSGKYVAAGLVPRGSKPDYPAELHVINVATKEIKQLIFGQGQQEVFDWR